MDSTRVWGSARLGTAPLLAEVIDEVDDVTESLEVQQGPGVTVWSLGGGLLPASVRPAHGNRRMRAIAQADNEVWINTPADTDDCTALTTEGVMGMSDGHPFQRWLEKRGSVLWGPGH
jgi:hypothetical protein